MLELYSNIIIRNKIYISNTTLEIRTIAKKLWAISKNDITHFLSASQLAYELVTNISKQ